MEAAGKSYPITREIEQALALIRRGCDELLIEAELAQYDPAIAARYEAADDDERQAILKQVAGADR